MDRFLLVLTAVLLAGWLLVALVPPSTARRHRVADRTARRIGLALDASVEPAIVGSSVRSLRCCLVGGAIGWGFGALTLPFDSTVSPSPATWVLFGLVVAGGAGGTAVSTALDARRADRAAGPRLARSRAVCLDDYLPRRARRTATAAVVVAVVVAVLAVTVDAGSPTGWAVVASAAVAVGAQLLAEMSGRRIVASPQSASSTVELAWSDALRARNLRAMTDAPINAGLYTAVAAALAASTAPVIAVDAASVLVVAVLLLADSGRSNRDRHFLRRLWPETAASAG